MLTAEPSTTGNEDRVGRIEELAAHEHLHERGCLLIPKRADLAIHLEAGSSGERPADNQLLSDMKRLDRIGCPRCADRPKAERERERRHHLELLLIHPAQLGRPPRRPRAQTGSRRARCSCTSDAPGPSRRGWRVVTSLRCGCHVGPWPNSRQLQTRPHGS